MKRLILAAVILTACSKGDDTTVDTTAADTAAVAAPSMASMFAGTWEGRSHRTESDSGIPWTQVVTANADGSASATIRFKSGTEDIPVRVTETTHTTMKSEFGPYNSPTAGGARGSATTEATLAGDSLVGTFIFTPEAGGAAINGRFVARRVATP